MLRGIEELQNFLQQERRNETLEDNRMCIQAILVVIDYKSIENSLITKIIDGKPHTQELVDSPDMRRIRKILFTPDAVTYEDLLNLSEKMKVINDTSKSMQIKKRFLGDKKNGELVKAKMQFSISFKTMRDFLKLVDTTIANNIPKSDVALAAVGGVETEKDEEKSPKKPQKSRKKRASHKKKGGAAAAAQEEKEDTTSETSDEIETVATSSETATEAPKISETAATSSETTTEAPKISETADIEEKFHVKDSPPITSAANLTYIERSKIAIKERPGLDFLLNPSKYNKFK